MDMYLQFGHGMMEHSRHLTERWGGATTILSPRDMTVAQLEALGGDLLGLGGRTLLDPQFYDPRADHHGLVKHDYWPDDFTTATFLAGPPLEDLLEKLADLNDKAKTDAFILPGLFCERVDDDWAAVQDAIVTEAARVLDGRRLLATVCLSAEAMRFEDQIETVLNLAEGWPVDGYYVVVEHPDGRYLVDDPVWLTDMLLLCAGMKTHGRETIVGYANHQMLCMGCAGVDAIASGTWLNVRCFTTGKFQEPDPDSVSRRAKWYYCPQALSEYKLPFMDMAFRRSSLAALAPDPSLASDYADVLFAGAQPSTTDYSEQQSFRHYLTCLRHQCHGASSTTFYSTCDQYQRSMDSVEAAIALAHRAVVRGQDRDFAEIVDVNRVAVESLVHERGAVLERIW